MKILTSAGAVVGYVFLIIAGAAVIGGLGFLLYYFVISRNAHKHQVRDLDKKYSYLDALLIGQDSQYIHRLEIISRTNLLYVERHQSFSRRFKEIYENDDRFAESMVRQLKALIANKQYKNIKSVINDAKKAIQVFEEKVNSLDSDLYSLIKPEEESRHSILKLKELYRRVKQTFYANSTDLDLVSSSFSKVFEKLDSMFVDFETHIESAEYDEAQDLIPTISKVVSALESALAQLPNLCILVNTVIPEKINDLSREYERVESQGLPLYNIGYKLRVGDWQNELLLIKECLVNLQTKNIMERLDALQRSIEEVRELLLKEIQDKDYFGNNLDTIYRDVVNLEKSFLKICSIMPEVEQTYIVNNEQKQENEILKQNMNDLSNAKQTLDNFVHSSTRQPYSLLKGKLDDLLEKYSECLQRVNSFKDYLKCLRTSSEEAYSMVFIYYYRLKQVESVLRDIGLDDYSKQYLARIENTYALLNEIDGMVKVKPIDVDGVNQKADELKHIANELFDEIESKFREMQLAESAIVYANRDRNHQYDVQQQLLNLETQFFNGEFVKVYHDANAIYKRNHVEDSNNATN